MKAIRGLRGGQMVVLGFYSGDDSLRQYSRETSFVTNCIYLPPLQTLITKIPIIPVRNISNIPPGRRDSLLRLHLPLILTYPLLENNPRNIPG